MGLPGPCSESAADIRPGEAFARSSGAVTSHCRSEESSSYADREIPGAVSSSHVLSSSPARGVAAHGKTTKSGVSDYWDCTGSLEGGSNSHFAGNLDVEDGTVWEYPLSNSSSATNKAAVRSDLLENNLYRPQKGASVTGVPTSIIVGFESQTSASSHITTSKHSSDNADALQVSTYMW